MECATPRHWPYSLPRPWALAVRARTEEAAMGMAAEVVEGTADPGVPAVEATAISEAVGAAS